MGLAVLESTVPRAICYGPPVTLVTEAEAQALFGGEREALFALVRRIAEPRVGSLRLRGVVESQLGRPLPKELGHFVEAFEAHELEVCDPAGAELLAPGPSPDLLGLLDPNAPAYLPELVGFFTASTPVVLDEEMCFLAALTGTRSGYAKVYYFHPQDWGLWPTDASLTARLFRTLQEEDRPELAHLRFTGEEEARRVQALKLFEALARPEPLLPELDPVVLFPRVSWLIHALGGVGLSFDKELPKAPPHDRWMSERLELVARPHLLAYWLWAHWFFDDPEGLEEATAAAARSPHPVVAGTVQAIHALLHGTKLKLGDKDRAQLLALKDELLERAPAELLSGPARHRRNRRRAEESQANRAEIEALELLEAQASSEPLVAEALFLLQHLARGSAVPPEKAELHGGLDSSAAQARLAELMDPRFRPVIEARLTRAAAVGDTHRDASFGLILALAALEPDFGAFVAFFERLGTSNFGPRRMQELYRAFGSYPDPRATKILAAGARAWLTEVDDWIRMAPSEPLLQLLHRDCLETHELIARLLERANYSAANFDICVRAAYAALELKSQRAIPGLERAVKQGLGRVDDGGRATVIRAYAQVAGEVSVPVLLARLADRRNRWESSDEDDQPEHQYELSCLLSGLLPVLPEDQELLAVARTLLALFKIRMLPTRTPRREVFEATKAIVVGAHQGDVRALAPAITPFLRLETRLTPVTKAAARALETAAQMALGDLS